MAATAAERRSVPRPGPRIYTGEVMSAVGALVLAPMMFTEWYGVVGVPQVRRSGIVSVESGWHGLTYLRWLMIASIVLALGAVLLHASQRGHGARTDTGLPVAVIGTITAVGVGYRVLVDLPDPRDVVDVKLGGFIGLLAVLAIAVGGWESARDERARRRATTPSPEQHAPLAPTAGER